VYLIIIENHLSFTSGCYQTRLNAFFFYVCLKHAQGLFQTPAISSIGVGYHDALADKRNVKVR